MKIEKRLAVILLNYNNYDETIRCVNRLENIGVSDDSIVVVDNHSTDGSVDYLKKGIVNIKIIENDVNGGYAAGNNKGILYAESMGFKYVCVMNCDMQFTYDFITPLIDYLLSNSDVGVVGPCLRRSENGLIAGAGGTIHLYTGKSNFNFKDQVYRQMGPIECDYISGGCMVAKIENLKDVGLIPEVYFLDYEDNELCMTLKRNGMKVVCLSNVYIFHEGESTIDKISGLGIYFMQRNRVLFEKRNANFIQKLVCYPIFILSAIKNFFGKNSNTRNAYKAYMDGITEKNEFDYLIK